MNYKILGLVTVALLVGPVMANAQVMTLDYQGNVFTSVNVSGNGSFPDTPTRHKQTSIGTVANEHEAPFGRGFGLPARETEQARINLFSLGSMTT